MPVTQGQSLRHVANDHDQGQSLGTSQTPMAQGQSPGTSQTPRPRDSPRAGRKCPWPRDSPVTSSGTVRAAPRPAQNTITERITSPRRRSSKARSTSSSAIVFVTIPARSSSPSSASCARRGKSTAGRWSPPCETRIRVRLSKNGSARARPRRPAAAGRCRRASRVAEHREALRDRLRPADDVEDEVEPLARRRSCVAPKRRAARASARRGRARGSPTRRRCARPESTDEPDRAAADHADARAFPDLRGLEHRADAGGDRAADQARLLGRQLVRDADRGRLVDDRARRERPELRASGTACRRPARSRRAARGGVRQRRRRRARTSGTRRTASASRARRARRRASATPSPDRLDDAGALVAEQHRAADG